MDELAAALNLDPAGSGFVASRTRARENSRQRRSFLECGAVLSELIQAAFGNYGMARPA
jgi:hypothetical protein